MLRDETGLFDSCTYFCRQLYRLFAARACFTKNRASLLYQPAHRIFLRSGTAKADQMSSNEFICRFHDATAVLSGTSGLSNLPVRLLLVGMYGRKNTIDELNYMH